VKFDNEGNSPKNEDPFDVDVKGKDIFPTLPPEIDTDKRRYIRMNRHPTRREVDAVLQRLNGDEKLSTKLQEVGVDLSELSHLIALNLHLKERLRSSRKCLKQAQESIKDKRRKARVAKEKALKDKEARDIPICPELYEILVAFGGRFRLAGEDSHVFTYKGKPIKDVRRALRDACSDFKIPFGRNQENGFTLHDLRHTFNTNMRKAGVPEIVIMSMTGHSTREMFLRYDTVDQTDTRKAVNQFSDFLKNVSQNVSQEPEAQKAGA
jgi:integrase